MKIQNVFGKNRKMVVGQMGRPAMGKAADHFKSVVVFSGCRIFIIRDEEEKNGFYH